VGSCVRPGDGAAAMTFTDVLVQQVVNGLALGMMYALLALGFTMVYGIIELINFAHFSVFMSGTFMGLTILGFLGFTGSSAPLTGLALAGTLVLLFAATMAATGVLGVLIERICLRPMRGVSGTAPMITTLGVAFILINLVLMIWGPQSKPFPKIVPDRRWAIGHAEVTLAQMLLGVAGLVLMVALNYLVRRTALGKAMRATAQDMDAAQMMGIDVDRIIVVTFFLGSALAGAGSLFFGLYYGFTAFYIGYQTGLRAFTSAVLGGIGNIPGAVLGGLLIGLIQSLGGQLLEVRWTDVIIFSILILVMVFRPTGLLGLQTPQKA
jgi:branched-chain amino acid transport system permease protein